MTQEEFERAKRAAYHAPKHTRISPLIDHEGNRWKWLVRQHCWAKIPLAEPSAPMFTKSKTICENRNKRRKSFGYKDVYSMRERGWPT